MAKYKIGNTIIMAESPEEFFQKAESIMKNSTLFPYPTDDAEVLNFLLESGLVKNLDEELPCSNLSEREQEIKEVLKEVNEIISNLS